MPSSSYSYIDNEHIYTDEATGVLKNKENLPDKELLQAFEGLKVSERLSQLQKNPILPTKAEDVLRIHRYLFQDVYDWAGQVRVVEISKNDNPFLFRKAFPKAFAYINTLLKELEAINADDKAKLADSLAEILDNLNYAHFFREGNGRTQREFLRCLALQKGYVLNLNPIDDASVYDEYMQGTIKGDIKALSALILRTMS